MKTLTPSQFSQLLATLQSISDDASHALGTDAEPQERLSVARQDLATIKESAKNALEVLSWIQWTEADQSAAIRDGWLVATTDTGFEIQRHDDSAVFDCDENAVAHVKQQARGPLGSPLCKRALSVVGLTN